MTKRRRRNRTISVSVDVGEVDVDVDLEEIDDDVLIDYLVDNGYSVSGTRTGVDCNRVEAPLSTYEILADQLHSLADRNTNAYREFLTQLCFIPATSTDDAILSAIRSLIKR